MYRIIFKLCILLSIVSPSLLFQNNYRKYNVDQESLKLYGEDFNSVLKRFRRTPDYLKILQDKLADLKTSAKEISLQVLHYYHGKLEAKISEIIPTTTTVAGAAPSPEPQEVPIPKGDMREGKKETNNVIYFHALGKRRQGEPIPEAAVQNSSQKIQNLDNYKVFDSQLSVSERNNLKNVGFEFAGKIIHSIIENMSPKQESTTTEMFTHFPEAGQSAEKNEVTTTTTTHPPEHAGTHKEDGVGTVHEESLPATKQLRSRASKAAKSKWYQFRRSWLR